jgi:hypothetical protein
MSLKERKRAGILSLVAAHTITLGVAATRLAVSYRHMKRIWKRYHESGTEGIVHKSRGRPSPRRFDDVFRTSVIAAFREKYHYFNPVHACEKLAKDGYRLSDETLRKWLIQEGLWQRRRKQPKHRSRREPKAHFGDMLQIDGSFHPWFGDRNGGVRTCLMVLIDDATNTTIAFMSAEETTIAALELLRRWILRYGVPRSIYCDRRNVYIVDREQTVAEQIDDIQPLSAFGKACKMLGIEIIAANSPQAKGRVERMNRTLQDRLLNEMRLAGIDSIEDANRFLYDTFLDEHNRQFKREALHPDDHHLPVPKGMDLNKTLCIVETRELSLDWIVRFDNQFFQVHKQYPLPPPRSKITVRVWCDGSVHLYYKDRELNYHIVNEIGSLVNTAHDERIEQYSRAQKTALRTRQKRDTKQTEKERARTITSGDTSTKGRSEKAPYRATVSKVFSRVPWNFTITKKRAVSSPAQRKVYGDTA